MNNSAVSCWRLRLKIRLIFCIAALSVLLQTARGDDWSHPAFANKFIYARNDKEIVCMSLNELQYLEQKTATKP